MEGLDDQAVAIERVSISACAQKWETSYDQNPSAEQSAGWRLNDVSVDVPRSLTVSDSGSFSAAEGDIVWSGEPPGDRFVQVARIKQEAAENRAFGLSNHGRSVNVNLTVNTFHALPERARAQLSKISEILN